jgi:hypothetical protein
MLTAKHIKLTPEVVTNLVPMLSLSALRAISFVIPLVIFREGQ